MYHGIRIAGFGGQGIISAGVLLASAGMLDDRQVTFFPSYGAEMRGGTANCSVILSSEEIASPVVTAPDTLIIMNQPSLDRFESILRPQGFLIINTSLVKAGLTRQDVVLLPIPCTELAAEAGNPNAANMVALGVFAECAGVVSIDSLIRAMPKVYKHITATVLEVDRKALESGAKAAAEVRCQAGSNRPV